MIEQEARTLEQICQEEGGLNTILLDNIYCSLGYNKKIGCKYQSEYKDHNGLYPCINPEYQNLSILNGRDKNEKRYIN